MACVTSIQALVPLRTVTDAWEEQTVYLNHSVAGNVTATLPETSYGSAKLLLDALVTALDTATADTWSWTHDETWLVTLSCAGGNWNTSYAGTPHQGVLWEWLGFYVNMGAAQSHTGIRPPAGVFAHDGADLAPLGTIGSMDVGQAMGGEITAAGYGHRQTADLRFEYIERALLPEWRSFLACGARNLSSVVPVIVYESDGSGSSWTDSAVDQYVIDKESRDLSPEFVNENQYFNVGLTLLDYVP